MACESIFRPLNPWPFTTKFHLMRSLYTINSEKDRGIKALWRVKTLKFYEINLQNINSRKLVQLEIMLQLQMEDLFVEEFSYKLDDRSKEKRHQYDADVGSTAKQNSDKDNKEVVAYPDNCERHFFEYSF